MQRGSLDSRPLEQGGLESRLAEGSLYGNYEDTNDVTVMALYSKLGCKLNHAV